jgi:hypothetical protein
MGTSSGSSPSGTGRPWWRTTCPSPSPGGTRGSPTPADLQSSPWISSTPCSDLGAGETLVALTPGQIPPPHCGISSSQRRH